MQEKFLTRRKFPDRLKFGGCDPPPTGYVYAGREKTRVDMQAKSIYSAATASQSHARLLALCYSQRRIHDYCYYYYCYYYCCSSSSYCCCRHNPITNVQYKHVYK